MRIHGVLLLIIALSIPALAAQPKPPGKATENSVGQATSSVNATGEIAASEETTPIRPAAKSRIHRTFPPPTKRM